MKSRSFLLVKDVLGRALDLPESERETFLTTSLGHDRELLAEARELLRFDDPSVGRDDALPHDKRALIGTTSTATACWTCWAKAAWAWSTSRSRARPCGGEWR